MPSSSFAVVCQTHYALEEDCQAVNTAREESNVAGPRRPSLDPGEAPSQICRGEIPRPVVLRAGNRLYGRHLSTN